MSYIPDEIKTAIDGLYGEFKHESFSIDIPPGDPAFTVSVGPKKANEVWQIYAIMFGELSPAGPTTDVWFRHWQTGVFPHSDPMVHSILDYVYPMWAITTSENPHYLELYNTTGEVQTLDLQMYMATFRDAEDYLKWFSELIISGRRFDIDDDYLGAMGVSRRHFEEVYEETKERLLERRPDKTRRLLRRVRR